jgi:hypothetical protein
MLTASVRSFAAIIAACVMLPLAIDIALIADAAAYPPPRVQKAEAVVFVREIFSRIFFKAWLGDAISLRTETNCSEAQIVRALESVNNFPSALVIEVSDQRRGSAFCSPATMRRDQSGRDDITIRVPRLRSCDDYSLAWSGIVSEETLAKGIAPYIVHSSTYEKFGIQPSARSTYLEIDRPHIGPRFTAGQAKAGQYYITETKEAGAFCNFALSVKSNATH